jgi:hypothetical protein
MNSFFKSKVKEGLLLGLACLALAIISYEDYIDKRNRSR